MNDAIIGLVGVLVGVVITNLSQLLIWHANSKQWQQEKSLETLAIRREELIEVFGQVSEETSVLSDIRSRSRLENRPIDPDEVDDMYQYRGKTRFILPVDVYETYQKYLLAWVDETKDEEFLTLSNDLNGLMGKHIRELDSEIDLLFDEISKPLLKRLF